MHLAPVSYQKLTCVSLLQCSQQVLQTRFTCHSCSYYDSVSSAAVFDQSMLFHSEVNVLTVDVSGLTANQPATVATSSTAIESDVAAAVSTQQCQQSQSVDEFLLNVTEQFHISIPR